MRRGVTSGVSKQQEWLAGALVVAPEAHKMYSTLEQQAARISFYAATVVPGLLQTVEYASALINVTPWPQERYAKTRVEARLVRQAIFGRQSPPYVAAIIDEAVLRRPVGGAEVMRRQLLRLMELNERPDIVIRVLPVDIGAHPGVTGQFTILDQEGAQASCVFCDDLTGGILRSEREEVERYHSCYMLLDRLALDPDESVEILAKFSARR